MIFVFCGTAGGVRSEYGQTLDRVRKELRSPEIVHLSGTEFNDELFSSILSGNDLFGGEKIVLLEEPFADEGVEERLFSFLRDMKESPHAFFLKTRKITASQKRKLESFGEVFEGEREIKKKTFNIFALADALLLKDRKKLWLLYQEALGSGASAEEIAGVLFWQLKTVLLVEAGEVQTLAPFVVQKARGAGTKWKREEMRVRAFELVSLYHEARTGKFPLETALERFLLSL